ncbi:MAG: phenylalanine--tRNA ligase subunit beta [Pseudomonadota bacterium]
MKISEAWLREWANPDVNTQQLVEQLTMAGLEVDGVESVAGEFSGVVVGEVVSAEQHPDADKLRVCKVEVGDGEPLQIICGAPNARQGIKVACAKIGAVLPGNFKIKKAKLRGVESFGMLCSSSELQISDENNGIIELPINSPVGISFREFLRLDDVAIDIDLTPNRGDCLGVIGVAREIGVINRTPVKALEKVTIDTEINDIKSIKVQAEAACPRYMGRIIKGINPKSETPLWMLEKLRRSGIRAIHPVVDITNYVLLEYGHPMHSFDLEQIEGALQIRLAKEKEKFTLLDGQEVTLNSDTLMIADDKKALAMAGIMGGENSGVTINTQDIFLESAFFAPLAIAGRARSYGLHTDASHRYERGVDPQMQRTAIERASQLILDITGGKAGPLVEVVSNEHVPAMVEISLRRSRIKRLIGIDFEDKDVVDILQRLGMQVHANELGWTVGVPSYRFDISLEEDLIEELVRIYGYNNLPVKTPHADMLLKPKVETRLSKKGLSEILVNLGYQEAITYSFVEQAFQERINPGIEAIPLLNPISNDLGVMRTSLLPGLIKAASYNLNRQQSRVRLFETGLRFLKVDNKIVQTPMISGVVTGQNNPEHWNMQTNKVDYFDVKGHVESLIALTGKESSFQFVKSTRTVCHPGQCAEIIFDDEVVGFVGMINPQLVKPLGVNDSLGLFELELGALLDGVLPEYSDFSKFPYNRRDIAVVVGEDVSAMDLVNCVGTIGDQRVKDVRVFDVYTGPGVEKGLKSVALGLTIRDPSHTLKETEISQIVDKVVVSLKEKLGATLRE